MAADGYLFVRGLIDRETVLEARREILLKYAIVGEIDGIHHDLMDAIQSSHSFIDTVNLRAFTESVGHASSNAAVPFFRSDTSVCPAAIALE